MSKPLITVVGATGAQGGGVVNALIASGKWAVRALTRNSNSDKSKALRDKNVEVIEGNFTKKEDLLRAFHGAYGVFAATLTNWELSADIRYIEEIACGKLMVDAAKESKVAHFVYSSLCNAEKISGGKHPLHHFTSKAHVDEYLYNSGLTATSVQIAGYYENLLRTFRPKFNEKDGVYEFTSSTNTPCSCVSVSELGLVVAKVFDDKEKYKGKIIPVTAEKISYNEIASTLSRLWGKPVRHNYVPENVFATFPFPGAADIADMFGFFNEFGYFDIWEGKQICPELLTFEKWAQIHFPKAP